MLRHLLSRRASGPHRARGIPRIMSRHASSSPIAPVGTNYTPVGKVDITAIRSAAAPALPKPTVPPAPRPSTVTPAAPLSSRRAVQPTAVGSAAAAARGLLKTPGTRQGRRYLLPLQPLRWLPVLPQVSWPIRPRSRLALQPPPARRFLPSPLKMTVSAPS